MTGQVAPREGEVSSESVGTAIPRVAGVLVVRDTRAKRLARELGQPGEARVAHRSHDGMVHERVGHHERVVLAHHESAAGVDARLELADRVLQQRFEHGLGLAQLPEELLDFGDGVLALLLPGVVVGDSWGGKRVALAALGALDHAFDFAVAALDVDAVGRRGRARMGDSSKTRGGAALFVQAPPNKDTGRAQLGRGAVDELAGSR